MENPCVFVLENASPYDVYLHTVKGRSDGGEPFLVIEVSAGNPLTEPSFYVPARSRIRREFWMDMGEFEQGGEVRQLLTVLHASFPCYHTHLRRMPGTEPAEYHMRFFKRDEGNAAAN